MFAGQWRFLNDWQISNSTLGLLLQSAVICYLADGDNLSEVNGMQRLELARISAYA